jgi:aminopeptidase N
MLRVLMLDLNTMREDRFTTFLREFYATHAGGRASTLDLQTAAQRQIGADLEWFFRQWVRGTAIPTYRVAFRAEPAEGGKYRVRLRVVQENVPEDFEMYVPIAIDLGQNRWARMRVHVKGPRSEQDLPLMPFEPKGLRFNELEGVLCEFTTVPW